jgi:glutamate dehydrogenase/leucine dehydrogenase
VHAFADVIGPHKDIPAPDVNTNAHIMSWIVDEWRLLKGAAVTDSDWGVVTGKPLALHGSEGRDEATGLGGAYIVDLLTKQEVEKGSLSVAIQGFGNAGSTIAHFLHEWGYRVVAVSDATTALFNPDGLDIKSLLQHTASKQKLSTYTRSTWASNNKE